MRNGSRRAARAVILTVMGVLMYSPSPSPKTNARSQTFTHVAQGAGTQASRTLPEASYRSAVAYIDPETLPTQFNLFQPKEPIVVDAHSAYPSVWNLPGESFSPVTYVTGSLINQLEHSSSGIVRLPPGDYSIPVRLY
jgi:hypothetical protein